MNEMENYKNKVKEEISKFINNNELDEAKQIIKEYEKLIPYDEEIYSMKGVIAIIEGNYKFAKRILKGAISIFGENFDFLYNLAYLYEAMGSFGMAYEHYLKALKRCSDEMQPYILEKIGQLEDMEEVIKHKKELDKPNSFPAVSIITSVYNTKEYIFECVDSVLNQSFKDFEWIILDNGCTDGSSEILEEYAKKDNRIKLFRNEKNSKIFNIPNSIEFVEYRINLKSEYTCILDSDDYLHKDFLKELYISAIGCDADISIAGSEMFEDSNLNARASSCPPIFYAKDISELGERFPKFYRFFRPVWGKLIKTPIYINTVKNITNRKFNVLNGSDTLICLDILNNANSIISIDKVLYYYRIRMNSSYNSFGSKERYLDNLIIFDESKKLLEGWNKVSKENINFIADVLYLSLKDSINRSVNATSTLVKDRINAITIILFDERIRKILNDRGTFINLLNESLAALNEISDNL